MNLETLKARHEEHRQRKEQCLVSMKQLADAHERQRLDMLACDGAMQGLALLIAEEERTLSDAGKEAPASQPNEPEAPKTPESETPPTP